MQKKITIKTGSKPNSGKLSAFNLSAPLLPADLAAPIRDYHLAAWEAYQQLDFPKMTEEAWRRTDIRSLDSASFQFSLPESAPRPVKKVIKDDLCGWVKITDEGISEYWLSEQAQQAGVIVESLREAQLNHAELVSEWLGKVISPKEDKFAAMVGAAAQFGIFIYVPQRVLPEKPIMISFLGNNPALAKLSHSLIVIDKGASLTLITDSSSTESNRQAFFASLMEVVVGGDAELKFCQLQNFSRQTYAVMHERVQLHQNAQLEWMNASLGGELIKTFSTIDLSSAHASARMSGLYFADENQHYDFDTQQNHFSPDTFSNLLYKGALLGDSHTVWQGMVYVAPGAIRTNGYQLNNNLILEKSSHADSIPGLEICADDVRCSHGATVGKVDEDQLFYLLSRGLSEVESKRLIVEGFFDAIIQMLPLAWLRERISQQIQEKLSILKS